MSRSNVMSIEKVTIPSPGQEGKLMDLIHLTIGNDVYEIDAGQFSYALAWPGSFVSAKPIIKKGSAA